MPTLYAQKQSAALKKNASAESVLDSSSQGEYLQRHADVANAAVLRAESSRPNNTGMPDNLKSGIESLSGFSMDDVRVHYNSDKPATVQALAYTQGTDIHVAPRQEKCLPHEAWHVAQQMAGRVSPTTNINGMPVNDNAALEHEADVMGEKAVQCNSLIENEKKCHVYTKNGSVQFLRVINAYEQGWYKNKKHEDLDSNTETLRNNYSCKAFNALNNYWQMIYKSPLERSIIKKARRYCPKETIHSEHIPSEEDMNRLEASVENKRIGVDNPLEVDEMLIINAHGGLDADYNPTFAGCSPNEFAKKIVDYLPNKYVGEIYLEGCSTGEQELDLLGKGGTLGNSSFVEIFREELMKMAKLNRKEINPLVKGNKYTSIPFDDGVYVLEGGNMNVCESLSSKCKEWENKKCFAGKNTKLHVDSTHTW